MEIEILLKKILMKHGLDTHGVIQEIAAACGMHRHTIGKIYRNQVKNPSLEVLGRICRWLESKGVQGLPGALYGARPPKLWEALAAPGGVRIYLGEYQSIDEVSPARRWVSRRDLAVAGQIIEELCRMHRPNGGGAASRVQPLVVMTDFVPFHFTSRSANVEGTQFEEDIRRARVIYRRMCSPDAPESAVLIGSQRVDYLVEYLVADLFNCTPFHPPDDRRPVPFRFVYRTYDRHVRSCFGVPHRPTDGGPSRPPGTYYVDENDRWQSCPWLNDEGGAGILITVYHPGTRTMHMAVLGFTGRSTEAIGTKLERDPESFWPPTIAYQGRRIGVYICRTTIAQSATPDTPAYYEVDEIIALNKQILGKYLRRARGAVQGWTGHA